MIEIVEINTALGSLIEKNSTIENQFSLKKGVYTT